MKNLQVVKIFNNPDTKVQFPAQNKPGYDLELGQVYELDGCHRAVLPEPVAEDFTRITFENPGGWGFCKCLFLLWSSNSNAFGSLAWSKLC